MVREAPIDLRSRSAKGAAIRPPAPPRLQTLIRALSSPVALLLVLLAAGLAFSAAAMGAGYPLTQVGTGGTDTKPESKCWFAQGSWWCLLLDGDDNYLYRYDGR